MDERQLHAFLVILETGSLTQAAERLGLAQPSLSQLLLRLEDELGAPLFQRTSRGVLATTAALEFQTSALHILNEFRSVRERVAGQISSDEVRIRIGVPATICDLFRGPFFERLANDLPISQIELHSGITSDVKQWLEDEVVDFAIMYNVEGMKSAVLYPMAMEPMILVSKTRPDVEVDRFGMESSGIDLRSEIPVLVLPESSNGMRRFISSTCSRAKVELSPRYVQNSVSVLKSIVRMGLASTILPHASVGDELERGLLSGREVLYPSMDRVVFIARKFAVAPDSLSAHVERTVKNCMHWMAASGYWRARPMEAG